MPDSAKEELQTQEEPSGVGPHPDEFDPTKVKVGNIRDPDKIAAKIEAARLEHNDAIVAYEMETNVIEEQPPAPKVQVIERRIETVVVEIPLGEPPHRFQNIHLEALLYGEHAQTWARLRQALRDKNARTADHREVRSGPDILRWLLEQFAAGM